MILNRRDGRPAPGGVYVGRPSPWGNPFPVTAARTRREAVAMFRRYAEARLREEPTWLDPLRGRDLVCWCAPLECHAEVLQELAATPAPEEAPE